MPFEQAPRADTDGTVTVRKPGDGFVTVEVTSAGKTESILMSEYNASRVFAMLALMLEIPLPRSVGKAIKL